MNTTPLPVKRRKRTCSRCGRKLWLREFRLMKNGYRSSWCHDCTVAYKKEKYNQKNKKPDGTFFSDRWQRVVVKTGHATRFHWSENSIAMLRRFFPITSNKEMAGMLGVSARTVERMACKLGLRKDKEYLSNQNRNNLMLANLANPKRHKAKIGGLTNKAAILTDSCLQIKQS